MRKGKIKLKEHSTIWKINVYMRKKMRKKPKTMNRHGWKKKCKLFFNLVWCFQSHGLLSLSISNAEVMDIFQTEQTPDCTGRSHHLSPDWWSIFQTSSRHWDLQFFTANSKSHSCGSWEQKERSRCTEEDSWLVVTDKAPVHWLTVDGFHQCWQKEMFKV